MADVGTATFRAVADFSSLRREAASGAGSLAAVQRAGRDVGGATQAGTAQAVGGLRQIPGAASGAGGAMQAAANTARAAWEGVVGIGRRIGQDLASGLGVATLAASGLGAAVLHVGVSYNDLEQRSRAAFTTILGSADAANQMMDKLMEFAKQSPFPREVFIQATQQLLAAGYAADEVIPLLRTIEDTTAAIGGNAVMLREVAYVFFKIKSAGKATAEDLNMLAERGINAFQIMADQAGTSVADIRSQITAGTISSDQAIEWLTKGMQEKFAGAAANVKNTWSGAVDRIKGAFRDLSGALLTPFIDPKGGGMALVWVNQVADAIRATLIPMAKALQPLFVSIGEWIGKWVTNAVEFVKAYNPAKIIQGSDRIASVVKTIGDAFADLRPVILGLGIAMTSGLLSKIPMLGAFIPAISPITGALVGLVLSTEEGRAAMHVLGLAMAEIGKTLGPILANVFRTLAPIVGQLAMQFAVLLHDAGPDLARALGTLLDLFMQLVTWALPYVIRFLEWLAEDTDRAKVAFGALLAAIVLEKFDGLRNALFKVTEELVKFAKKAVEQGIGALRGVGDEAEKASPKVSSLTDRLKALNDQPVKPKSPKVDVGDAETQGGNWATRFVSGIATGIGAFFGTVVGPKIGAAMAALAPGLATAAATVLGGPIGVALGVALAAAAIVGLVAKWPEVLNWVKEHPIVLAILALPVATLFAIVVVPIAAAIRGIMAIWGPMTTWLGDRFWDAAGVVGRAIDWIGQRTEGIRDFLGRAVGVVRDFATGDWAAAWDGIRSVADTALDLIGSGWDLGTTLGEKVFGAMQSLAENLPGWGALLVESMFDLGVRMVQALVSGLSVAIPAVFRFFTQTVPQFLVEAVPTLVSWLVNEAPRLIWGLIQGLIGAIPDLIRFFVSLPSRIAAAIPSILEWFRLHGLDIMKAIGIGLALGVGFLVLFFLGLPGLLAATLLAIAAGFIWQGVQWIMNLNQGLANAFVEYVIPWFLGLPGQLWSLVSSAGSWLLQTGRDVISGLWNGLVEVWGAVTEWFRGLPGTVVDLLKGIGESLLNAVKGAWNGFAEWWNGLEISWQQTMPGPIPNIDITLSPPDLPTFQTGGVVPGTGPLLAVVHGGETITPAGQTPPTAEAAVPDTGALAEVQAQVQAMAALVTTTLQGLQQQWNTTWQAMLDFLLLVLTQMVTLLANELLLLSTNWGLTLSSMLLNFQLTWNALLLHLQTTWGLMLPYYQQMQWWVTGPLTQMWEPMRAAADLAWQGVVVAIANAIAQIKPLVGGMLRVLANIAALVSPPLAGGVAPALDAAAAWAGAEKGAVLAYGRGGVYPAGGGGMKTSGVTAVVGEGRPGFPEYVVPTDPRYRKRAMALWQAAGSDIKAYQAGGLMLEELFFDPAGDGYAIGGHSDHVHAGAAVPWRWEDIQNYLLGQGIPARPTSTYRAGDVGSLHGAGRAADYGDSQNDLWTVFNALVGLARGGGGGGVNPVLTQLQNLMRLLPAFPNLGPFEGMDGLVRAMNEAPLRAIYDLVKGTAQTRIDELMRERGGMGGPVPPGELTDWILAGLALAGKPASWLQGMYARAMQESGGNPRAINLTDINAQQGHPSKGVMQMIDGTFAAYAVPGHGDIWNPIDNIAASANYIAANYGDPYHLPAGGYAGGGVLGVPPGTPFIKALHGAFVDEPTLAMIGEAGAEVVLPVEAAQSGGQLAQEMIWNVVSSGLLDFLRGLGGAGGWAGVGVNPYTAEQLRTYGYLQAYSIGGQEVVQGAVNVNVGDVYAAASSSAEAISDELRKLRYLGVI